MAWLDTGRSRHAGLQDGFESFTQERAVALESAARCHQELAEDERYKAEHCRLCPFCFRPVEKLDGCNSMRCGENWHGGAKQSGCGKTFDWAKAPPYQAIIEERSLPDVDIERALLSGAGCRHLSTRCAVCQNMVQGLRFRCIHCEDFNLCMDCERSFASSATPMHPIDHVFEVLSSPEDPPIEDMVRGTSVTIFGMAGSGAMMNGCTAKVSRYSSTMGSYELMLPNGSRPVVPKENVQPSIEDPAEAQEILERALGQQTGRLGFLGAQVNSLVEVAGASSLDEYESTFLPAAIVHRYDPVDAKYAIVWEEPPRWACQRCTFLNEPAARSCAVCLADATHAVGQTLIAVENIQPLACTMGEEKEIMQRHWAESRRLELAQAANLFAFGCNLDLPRESLVRVSEHIAKSPGHSGCAQVDLYAKDGTYRICLRDSFGTFQDAKLQQWVHAEELTPNFQAEVEPMTAAKQVQTLHQQETQRLQRVRDANAIALNCNTGLTAGTFVRILGDFCGDQLKNSCALIRADLQDGSYTLCLRDNDGNFAEPKLNRWMRAEELTPIFHLEEDPVRAARHAVEVHHKEAARLLVVREANALASNCSLGLACHSFVQVAKDVANVPGHSGCAMITYVAKDGSYEVCLRGDDGKFSDSRLRRYVQAEALTPLFHDKEDPKSAAEQVAQRNEEESARLEIVREANALAFDCGAGLPVGTFVELAPSRPWCRCWCDVKSSEFGPMAKFTARITGHKKASTGGLPEMLYEITDDRHFQSLDSGRKKLLACQGCVRPVFWSEAAPRQAARRARAFHAAAVARAVRVSCYAASAGLGQRAREMSANDKVMILGDADYPFIDSFDDLSKYVILEDFEKFEDLSKGIHTYGLGTPLGVQRGAIAPMIDGRDVVFQAPSGSGKTIALLLGVLTRIDYAHNACQVLIIAPTRECSNVILKMVLALGSEFQVRCHAVCGGGNTRDDILRLREGQHVVVGTPGKLFDMISKRHLRIDDLFAVGFDEAEETLQRGFKDQVFDIVKCLPPNAQLCISSSWEKMSTDLREVISRITRDAVSVIVRRSELSFQSMRLYYIAIEKEEWKVETIIDLFECITVPKVIVYCNRRRSMDYLADQLSANGFSVLTLHAELDMQERHQVMRGFQSGAVNVLVCTDFAQPDLEETPLVINFDLPSRVEDYLLRVGRRSRRSSRKGIAIDFVTNSDVRTMKDIEKYYNITIEEMPMDIADYI